jgi:hypothetical protein
MMKLSLSCLLILILSSVPACSKLSGTEQPKPFPVGDYQYTGYDDKGEKMVEGRLSITSVETKRIGSEDTTQPKGNWELKEIGKHEHIGQQVGSGNLVGTVFKGGELDINLNPNISDANVYLRGTIEGRRFHGTWRFNGYESTLSSGKFEAIRK